MKRCHDCPAPALAGYSRCEKHREAVRASMERKINERVARGVCGRCAGRPPEPGMKSCRRCLDLTQGWRDEHKGEPSASVLPGQLALAVRR